MKLNKLSRILALCFALVTSIFTISAFALGDGGDTGSDSGAGGWNGDTGGGNDFNPNNPNEVIGPPSNNPGDSIPSGPDDNIIGPGDGTQTDTGGNDGGGAGGPVVVINAAPTLSIPDQNVNEDAGFLDNLVDLFSFAADDVTAVASLVFGFVSQSAPTIISCSLDSGRFVDCTTQANQNGFSDVTVSATDSGGLTTFDTFRVNVNSVNDGPSVNIVEPDDDVEEDAEFDFLATATDPENDPLTYTLDFGDGTIITGNVVGGEVEATHTFTEEGEFTITVTVSDGSTTASDSVIIGSDESITSDVHAIIYIGGIAFDKESYRPGDNVKVFLNFENQGQEDLNDVRSTAIIADLGIRSNAEKVEADENDEQVETLFLELPKSAKKGRYMVELVIDIDGDRRIKYRPIDIK